VVEAGLIAMLSTRTMKTAAWSSCAATTALALVRVVFAIAEPHAGRASSGDPSPSEGLGLVAMEALVLTAFALLGAIVASRQPRNAVGWLLGLIPLSLGILIVSDRLYWHLATTTGNTDAIAAYAAWLGNWIWIPAIVPAFTVLPLLFPTGRALSRRWRALVWIAVGAATVMFAGRAFLPGRLEEYHAIVNPFGIDGAALEILESVGFAVLVPTALAAIASLVVRFRRSRGAERQQLKWVAAAAPLLPVAFSAGGWAGNADFAILLLALLIVAAAISLAMLRYRLYDIDVVINRTLVYGALTATLGAIYLGSVLVLQLALSGLTTGSALPVAASTLAVAALFGPARGRIQQTVDRRFYRRKYDAERTLAAFSAQLRNEVDLDSLRSDLTAVVAHTMQPSHVSLWTRSP